MCQTRMPVCTSPCELSTHTWVHTRRQEQPHAIFLAGKENLCLMSILILPASPSQGDGHSGPGLVWTRGTRGTGMGTPNSWACSSANIRPHAAVRPQEVRARTCFFAVRTCASTDEARGAPRAGPRAQPRTMLSRVCGGSWESDLKMQGEPYLGLSAPASGACVVCVRACGADC